MRLFSTEQVSKYHPDKYSDQISDAILDAYLEKDPEARVAVETLVKNDVVVLAGEINSKATIDHNQIVQLISTKLRYDVNQVIDLIGKQSQEIHNAVDNEAELAAGDQGIMFGYATSETESRLPYGFDLANRIIKLIEDDVENNEETILLGDAKTQVTVDLDEKPGPDQVKTIVISVSHCENCRGYKVELRNIRWYVSNLLAKSDIELPEQLQLIVNPAGTWNVGGPTADAGITGRKIVCDQYGGYAPVGGGAFSGKDPSKVDRSGSYAARELAVEILEFHKLEWVKVQLAYAIGIAEPVSINIESNEPQLNETITNRIDPKDYTPNAIIQRLKLTQVKAGTPKYEKLAEGCHYYAG